MSFFTTVRPYLNAANAVTVARAGVLPFVLLLPTASATDAIVVVLAVCLVFLGDGLDGFLARRSGTVSLVGSFLDILADRVVEWVLWLHFFRSGLLPFEFLVALILRSVIVDSLRLRAFRLGRVSPRGIELTSWRRELVLSYWSRAGYAVSKALLGTVLILLASPAMRSAVGTYLYPLGVVAVLSFSALRGIGILMEYGLPRQLVNAPEIESSDGKPWRAVAVSQYSVQLLYDCAIAVVILSLRLQ